MPKPEIVYVIRTVDVDGGRRGRTRWFAVAADFAKALDCFEEQSRPLVCGDVAAPFEELPRGRYRECLGETASPRLRRAVVCWRASLLVELLAEPLRFGDPGATRRPLPGQSEFSFEGAVCCSGSTVSTCCSTDCSTSGSTGSCGATARSCCP